jgi:hypothetical protein
MNGLLWTAAALAIAGLLAFIVGWFRTTPDDLGVAIIGLILIVLCEGIAVVLALAGFFVIAIRVIAI